MAISDDDIIFALRSEKTVKFFSSSITCDLIADKIEADTKRIDFLRKAVKGYCECYRHQVKEGRLDCKACALLKRDLNNE